MKLSSTYCRKENVAKREIAGEHFLIPVCGTPVDMESIFVLNPLADFIWERIDGKRTLAVIISEIVSEFAVEMEEARADAEEFVSQLLQHHLVKERA